jgi:ankyrin repeat protein
MLSNKFINNLLTIYNFVNTIFQSHINNISEEINNNLLFDALIFHEFDVTQKLINNGVDINCRDYLGRTPLIFCVEMSQYSGVEFLLKNHANVNLTDLNGFSALHLAVKGNKILLVELILYI